MIHPLQELITTERLLNLAGNRIFKRGRDCVLSGAVIDLEERKGKLKARVNGSNLYRSSLWTANTDLAFNCTCPMGRKGEFCKHLVAVGLAWLNEDAEEALSGQQQKGQHAQLLFNQSLTRALRQSSSDSGGSNSSLEKFLATQSRQQLLVWLIDECKNSESLQRKLEIRAERVLQFNDIDALKMAVNDILQISEIMTFLSVQEFTQQAESVIELIEATLEHGGIDVAAQLVEYAVERAFKVWPALDDSDGYFGGFIRNLADVHFMIFEEAGADYPLRAASLYRLKYPDDQFFFPLEVYAQILDKTTYHRYRALTKQAWENLLQASAGNRPGYQAQIRRVAYLLEEIGHYENNLDLVLDVRSRNMDSPQHFLEMAELLAKANRQQEALDWAEKGLTTFPENRDSRLVSFLVGQYQKHSEPAHALQLAWDYFREEPGFEAYKLFRKQAQETGSWETGREELLQWLNDLIRQPVKSDEQQQNQETQMRKLMLDIHLFEGNWQSALALAGEFGASKNDWLKLAALCEEQSPGNAILIYQAQVERIIGLRNKTAYRQASDIIKKIRSLTQSSLDSGVFNDWLKAIRKRHKAKRNFISELREVRVIRAD